MTAGSFFARLVCGSSCGCCWGCIWNWTWCSQTAAILKLALHSQSRQLVSRHTPIFILVCTHFLWQHTCNVTAITAILESSVCFYLQIIWTFEFLHLAILVDCIRTNVEWETCLHENSCEKASWLCCKEIVYSFWLCCKETVYVGL